MTIEVAVDQTVSFLQATLAQMNLSNTHELQAPAQDENGFAVHVCQEQVIALIPAK